MSKDAINKIKFVHVENNLSNKWLAEQLNKNVATISRRITNEIQPSIMTFVIIAKLLNVKLTNIFND